MNPKAELTQDEKEIAPRGTFTNVRHLAKPSGVFSVNCSEERTNVVYEVAYDSFT